MSRKLYKELIKFAYSEKTSIGSMLSLSDDKKELSVYLYIMLVTKNSYIQLLLGFYTYNIEFHGIHYIKSNT